MPLSHDYHMTLPYLYLPLTAPSVAPEVTSITRSDDGTVITVAWQRITLEQARGFFQYRVTLTPLTSNTRQAVALTKTIPSDQTSVIFQDLDPSVQYIVSVGVVNINNMDLVISAPPRVVTTGQP